MFLFLFYAAKVRRKFKPRKKLFHPVTTLFHYATTLSTKHKKKRPPEGNLFFILQFHHTVGANGNSPSQAHNQLCATHLNSPTSLTCPTRLTRPTLEPIQKVFKSTTSASLPFGVGGCLFTLYGRLAIRPHKLIIILQNSHLHSV